MRERGGSCEVEFFNDVGHSRGELTFNCWLLICYLIVMILASDLSGICLPLLNKIRLK